MSVETILQLAGGAFATLSVGGASVWIFKESIKAALMRSAQGELERQKHELQQVSEALRHDLQREMLKAQLDTARLFEVYPSLMEHLRKAEGAVGGFVGLVYLPDWTENTPEELDQALERAHVPGRPRAEVVELFRADRKRGADRAREVFRQADVQKARHEIQQARNYLILKSLFVSAGVRETSDAILQGLHSALVDVESAREIPSAFKNARESLKKASAQLGELESLMRAELAPRSSQAVRDSGRVA